MLPKDLIKKLNEAGVDPNVIVRLMLDDEPETVTPDEPEPAPAPLPAEPAPAPAPAAAAPQQPAETDKILEAIERLTGAVQAANIRSMSAGDPATAETADDILASVISPKKGAK